MKHYLKTLTWLCIVAAINTGCWPKKGIVLFQEVEGSSFVKEGYRANLKDPNSISVLLRVPSTPSKASEISKSSYSSFYNTIESELVKNGFLVRDRQLFNEIVSNRNESISQLAQGTETDLIIEIVELDLGIGYKTDNFLSKRSNRKVILRHGTIKMNGIRTRFKVYSILKNELIASLEFNFAPCKLGCEYKIDKDGTLYAYKNRQYIRVKDYQTVEKDVFEKFATEISKKLINELK